MKLKEQSRKQNRMYFEK